MSGQSGGGPFGGGDYIRDQFPETYDEYLAQKAGKEGGGPQKFVTVDNELGEVTLRLPPQYKEHQAELLDDLYQEFFGSPAGDPKVQDEMNKFVVEWLKKKGEEKSQSL
jgi:hypothetical protein